MNDSISRQAAINAHCELCGNRGHCNCDICPDVEAFQLLPPAEPVIVPCNYVKACNAATMDKLTSAVLYLDALEELRKHGYVLVDMRKETTNA